MPFILVAVGVLIGVALTVAAYRWLPASRSGVLRPAVSVNAVEDLPSNPAPDYGRLALDGLRDGVVLADRAGQIQIRNARAESPTGTHHGDALINASVQRRVTQTVNGEATHESVELLDPARRVFRTSASPLPGGGVIVTISDVTEQARLDAVRTDFVANISHEFCRE